MKRSEMVKIIARELRAQSSGNCDIDPDQLLSVMESFGIQPPGIGKPRIEFTKERKWEDE